MTLLELTEPLFQYLCRVNRAARKGAPVEFAQLRLEVQNTFDAMRGRTAGDPHLANQFETMEGPLVFFVDSMISESKLPCARDWDRKRLAYERREVAGDDKFFETLEQSLKESSPDAADRLAVYYTCLGLGFVGSHRGDAEFLRRKMIEIAQRIRHVLEADPTARICPEDYTNVDTRDLRERTSNKVWLMVVIFVVGALTALACNLYFFYSASSDLQNSLKVILQQEKTLGS